LTSRSSGFLEDILLSARLAMSYVERTSFEEFAKDIQLQDSVIRRLEIIGEAASNIAEDAALKLPELPWRKMVDMRNFTIHQYWDVDVNIVWETVKDDLPLVVAAIERYLGA
jgi:uncharacterized protein with HEPN domain